MKKYYWYTFADGYSVCVTGFSKNELKIEIAKHGVVVSIERA
jgi:HSP20 family molecular chaperone IbpA